MNATIWLGPVLQAQAEKCVGYDSTLVEPYLCYAPRQTGKAYCPDLAHGYVDANGRVLPMLLADHGVNVADVQNVYIGSFSAGFSIARQILMSDQDRALVRVVALADSSYSSGTNTNPDPTEGYVRYGLDCLKGDKLFIATASTNASGTNPSCADVLWAVANEIGRRSGQAPVVDASPLQSLDPPPVTTISCGPTVLFGNWGGQTRLAHNDHRDKLAPIVWSTLVNPWAESILKPPPGPPGPFVPVPGGGGGGGGGGGSDDSGVLILVAVAAAGFLGYQFLKKK